MLELPDTLDIIDEERELLRFLPRGSREAKIGLELCEAGLLARVEATESSSVRSGETSLPFPLSFGLDISTSSLVVMIEDGAGEIRFRIASLRTSSTLSSAGWGSGSGEDKGEGTSSSCSAPLIEAV